MEISGIVVFEDIEGGVWGIVGDDGVRYQIMNELPQRVREPGRHVDAEVEDSDAVTIFQWGRPVKVVRARIN
jgi:hypothetical protein